MRGAGAPAAEKGGCTGLGAACSTGLSSTCFVVATLFALGWVTRCCFVVTALFALGRVSRCCLGFGFHTLITTLRFQKSPDLVPFCSRAFSQADLDLKRSFPLIAEMFSKLIESSKAAMISFA